MRVIVASSFVPFADGGDRFAVDWLHATLAAAGHDVESILLPFADDARWTLEQMLAYRMLDLTESCDRLITLRFPSHLLRHPCKVAWLVPDVPGPSPAAGPAAAAAFQRRLLEADAAGLAEARAIFTTSATASERLRRVHGLASEPLPPPPDGAASAEGLLRSLLA
jgi:hypothetical protein